MPLTTTPSGLQYEDTVTGTGKEAQAGRNVTVHYTGWLYENGTQGAKFDSSKDRDEPFVFPLGGGMVINEKGVRFIFCSKNGVRFTSKRMAPLRIRDEKAGWRELSRRLDGLADEKVGRRYLSRRFHGLADRTAEQLVRVTASASSRNPVAPGLSPAYVGTMTPADVGRTQLGRLRMVQSGALAGSGGAEGCDGSTRHWLYCLRACRCLRMRRRRLATCCCSTASTKRSSPGKNGVRFIFSRTAPVAVPPSERPG